MPVKFVCSPDSDEPTHHAVLWDDDGNGVGLIAVVGSGNGNYEQSVRGIDVQPANQLSFRQTSSPGTAYSDFERPYSYDEQITWNNGRGDPYQAGTPTTFYDSMNAWTMNSNQVLPAGQVTYAQGYRDQDFVLPGNLSWQPLLDSGVEYLDRTFVASASYSADKGYIICRRVGTPPAGITFSLSADSGGEIGTQLQSVTLTVANTTTDYISVRPKFDWTGTQALVSGTTYHVTVSTSGGDSANHWKIGVSPTTVGTTRSSADGTTWAAASVGLYFRVTDVDVARKWHFFEYKGLLYTATEPESAAVAPQIFRNGWRGDADDNAADKTKLNDTTQTGWTTAKLSGGVVKIWAGQGHDDNPNFRDITAAESGIATVDPAFYSTHLTTTQYVIRGTDWWTEMTGHGITAPIRSVVAPADVVYFALGYGTNIRRGGEYDNSGVWTTRTWADDGSNKADILAIHTDQVDGVQVVSGSNSDAGSNVSVSRANIKAWGDDLQFGVATPLGQSKHKINGIADGDKYIYVGTEAAIYALASDTMDKVIDFQAFTGPDNAKAMLFSSPYVYFSMGRGGFERLLQTNMEDIGLWRLEGWPTNRQGPIAHGVGHPQYTIGVVDAGADGYSSVCVWNNGGWHEIYRAPETGQRIRSAYYEVVPGAAIDRLWIGQDSDIVWVPMPNVLNPYQDANFRYTYETVITSSWIIDAARDMLKYFKNMKIFAENLSSGTRWIEWDYQTDSDTDSSAWKNGAEFFDTSPSTQVSVKQECKRFRYRLRCYTISNETPWRIIANTLALISGVPPKKIVNITFRIREEDGENVDLNGDGDGGTYLDAVAQLNEWASHPSPVHLASIDVDADGLEVLVQPAPRRPLAIIPGESASMICSLKLQEA